jgi:hypothetical protein
MRRKERKHMHNWGGEERMNLKKLYTRNSLFFHN